MSIEVIPAGASAVVSDNNKRNDDNCERFVQLMEAIKDAQSHSVGATKDAQANEVEVTKDAQAHVVEVVRDAEASLERSLSSHFENVIQDVKDSETRLNSAAADRFMQTIQDIKDAETRLNSTAADRFIQTIQDIKDAAKDTALASGHTNERIDNVRYELTKNVDHTREVVGNWFRDAEKTAYQNALENLKQFKETELRAERLAAHQALLSEKLAARQELLSEKLAAEAQRKADECCCELKREIAGVKDAFKQNTIDSLREQLLDAKLKNSRYRTFAPVSSGTLVAGSDGE